MTFRAFSLFARLMESKQTAKINLLLRNRLQLMALELRSFLWLWKLEFEASLRHNWLQEWVL